MTASGSLGTVGIKLLDAPTAREQDPRAHEYIIDHVAPGTAIQRRVQITSTARTTMHVDLYAGAATIDAGRFDFADGDSPNDLTDWVTIAPPSRDLPAGGTETVPVTIRVPPQASAGERYAVLWAQVSAAPADATGVRMAARAGVRVYLDVGPGGEPPSDFQILSLTPARGVDGRPQVLAQVRNTGQRALDMTGDLRLSDGPSSLSAGPFPVQLGTTLGIGQSEPVAVSLDTLLPDGPWTARLTLASGTVQHTISVTLTFPHTAGAGVPVAPSSSLTSATHLLLSGALLAAGALFVYMLLRRRRAGTLD